MSNEREAIADWELLTQISHFDGRFHLKSPSLVENRATSATPECRRAARGYEFSDQLHYGGQTT